MSEIGYVGVAGGPAGVVWHGAPAAGIADGWARKVRASRVRLEQAVDDAQRSSSQVALVLVDLGLVRLAPYLPEIMGTLADRVRSRLRPDDLLELVGEDQLAVLVVDRSDDDVAALAERVADVFDERVSYAEGETRQLHGTVVWVSGTGDLLWRAFYENAAATAREHHLIFSEGVFGMPGMVLARTVEDLAALQQFFAAPMGMEALELDVPGVPDVVGQAAPPDREPDGHVPIRIDGREAGQLRWWTAPGEVVPDHPMFYTALSAALSETLQRLLHVEALATAAAHDPLTGLLNRRGLYEQVDALPGGYAVALVDVDDFKAVNTAIGLAGGDAVLVEVARVLREGRSDDIVGRWGGEEFLLVLPEASVDEAAARLQRMLDATTDRVLANGKQVTFSCGIALGGKGTAFDAAAADADRFLRRAKSTGKARVLTA